MEITVGELKKIASEYKGGVGRRFVRSERHVKKLVEFLTPLEPDSRPLGVHEMVKLLNIILAKNTLDQNKESGKVFLNLIKRLGGTETFTIFRHLLSNNQLNDENTNIVFQQVASAHIMTLLLDMVEIKEHFAQALSLLNLKKLDEKVYSINVIKDLEKLSVSNVQTLERIDAKLLNNAYELLNSSSLLVNNLDIFSKMSPEHLTEFFKTILLINSIKTECVKQDTISVLCSDHLHCKVIPDAIDQTKTIANQSTVVVGLLKLLSGPNPFQTSTLFLQILNSFTAAGKETDFIELHTSLQEQLQLLALETPATIKVIYDNLTELKKILVSLDKKSIDYIYQIFIKLNIIPLFKEDLESLIKLGLEQQKIHFVLQKHLSLCNTIKTGDYAKLGQIITGIDILSKASLVSNKNLLKLINHPDHAEQIANALCILSAMKIDDPEIHTALLKKPEHALILAEGLQLLKKNELKLNGTRSVFMENFRLLLAYPDKAPTISQFFNCLNNPDYNWVMNNYDYSAYTAGKPKGSKRPVDELIKQVEYTLEILEFAKEHNYPYLAQINNFCFTKALNTPEFIIILHALAKAKLIQVNPNPNAIVLVMKNTQILKPLALKLDANVKELSYSRLKALIEKLKDPSRLSHNPNATFAAAALNKSNEAQESTPSATIPTI